MPLTCLYEGGGHTGFPTRIKFGDMLLNLGNVHPQAEERKKLEINLGVNWGGDSGVNLEYVGGSRCWGNWGVLFGCKLGVSWWTGLLRSLVAETSFRPSPTSHSAQPAQPWPRHISAHASHYAGPQLLSQSAGSAQHPRPGLDLLLVSGPKSHPAAPAPSAQSAKVCLRPSPSARLLACLACLRLASGPAQPATRYPASGPSLV